MPIGAGVALCQHQPVLQRTRCGEVLLVPHVALRAHAQARVPAADLLLRRRRRWRRDGAAESWRERARAGDLRQGSCPARRTQKGCSALQ